MMRNCERKDLTDPFRTIYNLYINKESGGEL